MRPFEGPHLIRSLEDSLIADEAQLFHSHLSSRVVCVTELCCSSLSIAMQVSLKALLKGEVQKVELAPKRGPGRPKKERSELTGDVADEVFRFSG